MKVFETTGGLGYNQKAYLLKLDESENGHNYLCIGRINIQDSDSYAIGSIEKDIEAFYINDSPYKIEDSPLYGTFLFDWFIKHYNLCKHRVIKEPLKNNERYAKKSNATGRGMNSGYVFNGGEYYCETEQEAKDFVANINLVWEDEIKKVCTNDEWFYYTEWQEIDNNSEYYDYNGNTYLVCQKCKKETRVIEDFYFCKNCLAHL